jgi:ATP-binding cassette subfamily B protein
MKTIKELLHFVDGYWKDTILTWVFVLTETACEILVVFFMQYLINDVSSANLDGIINNSIIIASIAIVSVVCGISAGFFAASASAGFGKNLREAMYVNIQNYSFSNIDKFSTSSIITRTTTDVTNVQNAFLQLIRTVIRAPFLVAFALVMCFITDWHLAWIFLIIIPFIFGALILLASRVYPYFKKIFTTYDNLNELVQEDVDGIRVVKSFNREDYQKEKFHKISEFIYKYFIKAERVISWSAPIMNLAVYGSIIAISYLGALAIVNSGGTELTVGGLLPAGGTLERLAQQAASADRRTPT